MINSKGSLLTLAIPTFESHSTLFQLLEDLSNQWRNSFSGVIEILISDNDPFSNLESKLDLNFPLIRAQINYHRNKINIGYDLNLCKLSKMANGKYIKFIADDDRVHSNFLQNLMDFLIKEPEFNILIHNFIEFENNVPFIQNSNEASKIQKITNENMIDSLKETRGLYGQVSSLTFRSSLIKCILPKHITNYVHVFWFFSIFESGNVYLENAFLVFVRRGSPNFSTDIIQKISIPIGSLQAIRDGLSKTSMLRSFVILEAQNYCFNLLKSLRYLNYVQKFKILLSYRNEFRRRPFILIKWVLFLAIPKFVYFIFLKQRESFQKIYDYFNRG